MTDNELDVYEQEAENWWKPGSKMALLRHFNEPRFKYFANFINNWRGLKVLDVGCGGGFTSEYLYIEGAVVYGIDISSKLIETAKNHAQEKSMDIHYQTGNAENIPYETDFFDVAIGVDVLEHVSDVGKVLSEVKRVLKRNGVFLFDTINKSVNARLTMITMMENTLNVIPKGSHDWNKFIPPETLINLLTTAGFTDIKLKGFEIKVSNPSTGELAVELNDNLSVVYIGKATG